jgi:hypothetical protein
MAIQQTSDHPTIRTAYQNGYVEGALAERLYDNFCSDLVIKKTLEGAGSSVTVVASSDIAPQPDAAVGNENADFTPQTIGEITATPVTLEYLNGGLKAHELAALESTFQVEAEYARKVGQLATETIDAKARRQATEGSVVMWPAAHTTRATLDLGTANDHMGYALFTRMLAFVSEWNIPKYVDGKLMVAMDGWAYQDLLSETGSPLLLRQGYTSGGAGDAALFKNEVSMLGNIHILQSRLTKVFYGAGAANAAPVATTLNGSIKAGAKTLVVSANTNIAVGMWLTIGTVQTSTESDATYITEPVYVTGVSTTTITFQGRHELGGMRFAHASGVAISNADSVHSAVFGGSASLAKAYNPKLKEFGMLVHKTDGMADQWQSWAFKWLGGYGRVAEGRLARAEVSASGM